MRKISKGIATSIINIIDPNKDMSFDENGFPLPNVTMEVSGTPSMNKARILAQREFGRNVMVVSVDTDESKLTLDSETFYAHSSKCENGATYGHDMVTLTFKVTQAQGFAMTSEGMKPFDFEMVGTTTANKLHNAVCDATGSTNVIITTTNVVEERRYMSREQYVELAKAAHA